MASTRAVALGSQTCSTAPLTMSAYDEVVDVLARAAEVDQLRHPGQAGCGFADDLKESTFQEVLDSLDVMGRLALDLGELADAVLPEVIDDRAQGGLLIGGEGSHARHDPVVGEMDQPLNLDAHALAVERSFGEVIDQRGDGGAVAAVKGAEGDGRKRVRKRDHAGHPPRRRS